MNKLKTIKKKHSGRDASGGVSVRHQGGQHKRYLRSIDFKRDKHDITARVIAVEYDPNRSSDIALVQYADGQKRYILRPEGLEVGGSIASGKEVELKPGNTLPLGLLPVGTVVHNIELTPGKGGQLARSAGASAIIQAREGGFVHIKMPSGEVRKISIVCVATVGQLGNVDWKNKVFKKAGTKRNMGIRPTVRGVAQNPRSHPHGGGEGRSGVGLKYPKTFAGRKAVGKTRSKSKYSNTLILQRRKTKHG